MHLLVQLCEYQSSLLDRDPREPDSSGLAKDKSKWVVQSGHTTPKDNLRVHFRCMLDDLPAQFSEMIETPDKSTLYHWPDFMIKQGLWGPWRVLNTSSEPTCGLKACDFCKPVRTWCHRIIFSEHDKTDNEIKLTGRWVVVICVWSNRKIENLENIDVRDLLPAWGSSELVLECARRSWTGAQIRQDACRCNPAIWHQFYEARLPRATGVPVWTMRNGDREDTNPLVKHQGVATTAGLKFLWPGGAEYADDGKSVDSFGSFACSDMLVPDC
ncbi:hypothetical protein QBC38DRAFT_132946 [Podospora fimiseda]|uniref:Uncharacterized protein n=1 Tax=Podospora fimiseda TaxID=252190 RepID=A0AAN7BSU4_9PEZI|nr:hypothetical protein QBC38DRAFT_132946 [Podospora fimiseda]